MFSDFSQKGKSRMCGKTTCVGQIFFLVNFISCSEKDNWLVKTMRYYCTSVKMP